MARESIHLECESAVENSGKQLTIIMILSSESTGTQSQEKYDSVLYGCHAVPTLWTNFYHTSLEPYILRGNIHGLHSRL